MCWSRSGRKVTCDIVGRKLTCRRGRTADLGEHPKGRRPDDDMIHAFHHPILVEDLDDGPVIVRAMPARPKYLR